MGDATATPMGGMDFQRNECLDRKVASGMHLLKFELICSKLLHRLQHTNLGIPDAREPMHPFTATVCAEEVEFGPDACTVWKNVRYGNARLAGIFRRF